MLKLPLLPALYALCVACEPAGENDPAYWVPTGDLGGKSLGDAAIIDAGMDAAKDVTPPAPIETMTFTVSTIDNNGHYRPRNVGAIWIERADGTFVRTLEVWAIRRQQHLVKWNRETGGSRVDAVSHATLPRASEHVAVWNYLDVHRVPVADGPYKMLIEFTEDNSAKNGILGPWTEVPFVTGPAATDFSVPPDGFFSDVQVTYQHVASDP